MYALVFVAIGALEAWRESRAIDSRTARDAFYVNGRASSSWLSGISIIASCVGGSATLGMAGLAWQTGMPAFWWLGSGACGLIVLAFFLAKKVRNSGALTMPEMLDHWLGGNEHGKLPISPRRLAAFVIVLAWLGILAAQFSAMGQLVSAMARIDIQLAILLSAVIIVLYAAFGGQATVIRSDLIQFMLMSAGLVCVLVFLVIDNPYPLKNVSLEIITPDFPMTKFAYFMIVMGSSYIVCPMLFGRILSTKNVQSAVSGCKIAIIGLLICALVITAIGIACRGLVAPDTAPDAVLSQVMEKMPGWLTILLMLALISAILSSADSCLITISTIFCNDLLPSLSSAWHCRLATLCFGLCATWLAMQGRSILELLLLANDIYVSGVVAPVFFGLVLPHGQRQPQVSLSAIVSGAILGVIGAISGEPVFIYLGIAFSGGIMAAGGLWIRFCKSC